MKIGLFDVDGHNYPNLALMKISAWHKAQGDEVSMIEFPTIEHYDKIYVSKVFSDEYSKMPDEYLSFCPVESRNATVYMLTNRVEHCKTGTNTATSGRDFLKMTTQETISTI